MFCLTRASLPAFALVSSIQSGWFQSSGGIKPNETFELVTAATCLYPAKLNADRIKSDVTKLTI